MPTRTKKSWHEKLHTPKDLPKTITITGKMIGRWGTKAGDTCIIPAPLQVDALMRQIPKGKLTTINHLRTALAAQHRTTVACPITTGIFSWLAAHAAEEARQHRSPKITPYWRTLKNHGELNPKYPGGIPALKKLLTAEGHKITKKGARHFVANYTDHLASLHPAAK